MKASLLKIAILLLLASSCKMYDTSAQYTFQRPDSLSDGFDAGIIEEAVDEIRRGRYSGINIPGEPSGKLGYSYSWWTKDYFKSGKVTHMYAAGGFGGQHIMVLHDLNTVVVFTGGNYLSRRPPFKIIKKYVIPALD